MTVEIIQAVTKCQLKTFCEYPNKLYKGNPYYVPTLVADDYKTFSKKHNAAYEFCDAAYFLAYKDGEVVGRVAAILNTRANETWNKNEVRFGWIDFIDDEEVSSALIGAVESWAKERGLTSIEGPLGFTDFDTEGMLVEGFEELGTMITFYNHPYYKEHLEKLGFTKQTDWVERRITVPDAIPEKIARFSNIIKEKYELQVVKYTRKEINEKGIGYKLFDLINNTYCVLYGYSKLSDKQIKQYVDQYLSMIDLELVTFINNKEGELVAFGIMIPSMSEALQKANGKYFPFGWYHLLRALYLKKTDTVDMMLIAAKKELQSKGIPALIINELIPKLWKFGFKYAETNPELEDNHAVQNLWNSFESRQHKRRRIYGKEIK
ncbi:MAG: N-acetyltransferase [Bacteroidales bacterium]|nr:N-acetyltransferase [Bacteroidales bacterium]